MSRDELVELVRKLLDMEIPEDEEPKYFAMLRKNVPDPDAIIRYMYRSGGNLTPSEIVDKALADPPREPADPDPWRPLED